MRKIRYYALFWALALSVVLVMGLGGYWQAKGVSRGESWLEAAMRYPGQLWREHVTEPASQPTTEPATEPSSEPTTEPATEPATEPTQQPTQAPETLPTEPPGPLAVYGEDESYFDDALFIGDSRTDGLRLYSPLGGAAYFCTTGMTIFDVWEETAPNAELVEQTLGQVLGEKKYGKIYITLGLNELSVKDVVLKAEFQMVLNHLKKAQPEAKLILHGIMPLSKEKSASESYFSMERIRQVNDLLRSIAGEMDCYYLDATAVFAGEDGYLRDGLSFDGCHLYAKNYWMWAQFLCENAV